MPEYLAPGVYVEETGFRPDGDVLIDDPLVLDRHLPPEELDHPAVPFFV